MFYQIINIGILDPKFIWFRYDNLDNNMTKHMFTPTLRFKKKYEKREIHFFIGLTNCYLSPTKQLLNDIILE